MDSYPGGDRAKREPSTCAECETCSPDPEGKWTGRIDLALPLAQLMYCLLTCRRRNDGLPVAEVEWLPSLMPGATSLSAWATEWRTRDLPCGHEDDVWVGLTPDGKVYLRDVHCRRPDNSDLTTVLGGLALWETSWPATQQPCHSTPRLMDSSGAPPPADTTRLVTLDGLAVWRSDRWKVFRAVNAGRALFALASSSEVRKGQRADGGLASSGASRRPLFRESGRRGRGRSSAGRPLG